MPLLLAHLRAIESRQQKGIAFGDSRVYELSQTKNARVIVVVPQASSLDVNWDYYVVESGKMPTDNGEHYLVVDRELQRHATDKATTPKDLFAPAYPTVAGDGVAVHIDLRDGPVTIEEFKKNAPSLSSEGPERIVLATVGDTKPLTAALASGGGKLPPWTSGRACLAEPPERRGPFVFLTKNTRRASAHLIAVEKQDPLKADDVAAIDLGLPGQQDTNLDEMWFTPERGDHARVILIAGDNTPEFRNKLKQAAAAGLLVNKQIALATCIERLPERINVPQNGL